MEEIKVMQFGRSDVLRQRRLKNQLAVKEFRDELLFRKMCIRDRYGVEQVESLEISDEKTGSIETISDPGCGIFVYAGTIPNTELYTERCV